MSCCQPEPRVTARPPLPLAGDAPARIAPAVPGDRPDIEKLLDECNLLAAGLADARLFVARDASGKLVGTAGLEARGRHGLLRSLAVAPGRRGAGLGRALVAAVEADARALGLEELWLLTTDAAPFFTRLGWVEAGRADAPEALNASAEWSDQVCPTSSAVLRRPLAAAAGAIRDVVRERYGAIARGASACCSSPGAGPGYDAATLARVPGEANLGLGCGTPLAAGKPVPGETVLDLGSGGGLDALLAAEAVGPSGRVIGVDMTPDMLARARAAAARAGATNVEFREGLIEKLPVDDASVDLVISNCVINLSPDKDAVFREVHRVLRPKGRLAIADIVAEGELPAAARGDSELLCACIGGADVREDYLRRIREAGFTDVAVVGDSGFAEVEGVAVRSITVVATRA